MEFLFVEAFSRCNYKLFVVKQYSVFNVVLIGIIHFLVELIPELEKYSAEDEAKEMRRASRGACDGR